jgi:hypothetical protein
LSRSNPFAKKPRKPNQTVLAVGEGETEQAFLKFLKLLYNKRDNGISIKIKYSGGGGPECVIDHTIKMNPENYDRTFVLIDNDKPCSPKHIKKAKMFKLNIIWCDPCVEGLFLKILGTKINTNIHNSAHYKKLFEDIYLNSDDKLIPEKYNQLFPYDLLEKSRISVNELDQIINLMT